MRPIFLKISFGVLLFFQPAYTILETECGNIKDEEKFDCYPESGANEVNCKKRGCCWTPLRTSTIPPFYHFSPLDVPWCYYPKNYGGYLYSNSTSTEKGIVAFFERTFPSPYPNDVKSLRLDVEYQTDYRVRVKISDAEKKRYESIYPKLNKRLENKTVTDSIYKVDVSHNNFGFKISRKNGDALFSTQNLGGFIFADQFLQISCSLPGRIYGLGEHRTTFWLNTNWTRYTLFAHDSPPKEKINLYGSHPFYLVMESNGRSHGVFLHNSNAIDVLLQPLPALTFRAIGGILDFYFFMGPTPADVIRQYTELIGRPFLPPYWSLGFQLCKYGYGSAENMRAVWQRTRNAKIPYDVQWSDIDYMHNQNDFTVDPVNFKTLSNLVNDIHNAGMHFVPILDPGVSASEPPGTYPPYDEGLSNEIFIKNQNGSVFIGKVWNPKTTAFPDFTNPKTYKYWMKLLWNFHQKIPFDGLWIDMNEPSNFLDGTFDGCPNNELENPPYVPGVDGGKLYYKTLCMSTEQFAGKHYDVHNLYGISEAEVTFRALQEITGKRGFILSRSTFPGSGKYTAHWTGDNFSTWHDLTKSIPALLSFSLYGIPFTGADICGFIGNTTKNLCNRWMQLGAFYPFSRNHNSLGNSDQDPVALGDSVVRSSINALTIRYTLLPYLYTLFYKAHIYGDTVARPLFFEFPEDEKTHEIDRAFLWGSGLYIIPITDDNSEQVHAYLPAGKWYDWYTLTEITSKGENVILKADNEHIPLLLRGGTVFPMQKPGPTTTESRQNSFTFLVAPNSEGKASGDLFWDDGISTGSLFEGVTTEVFFEGDFPIALMKTQSPIQVIPALRRIGGFRLKSAAAVGGSHSQFSLQTLVIKLPLDLPTLSSETPGRYQLMNAPLEKNTISSKKYGILNFTITDIHFTSKVITWNVTDIPKLETIIILGVKNVTKVILNKKEINFESNSSALRVSNINLLLNIDIELSWN